MPKTKNYMPKEFGERIKNLMIEKNITIKELCIDSKLTRFTLCNYINKNVNPSAYNLIKLCNALNVSADYLLFGEERK